MSLMYTIASIRVPVLKVSYCGLLKNFEPALSSQQTQTVNMLMPRGVSMATGRCASAARACNSSLNSTSLLAHTAARPSAIGAQQWWGQRRQHVGHGSSSPPGGSAAYRNTSKLATHKVTVRLAAAQNLQSCSQCLL
jgi:hypothetical protein